MNIGLQLLWIDRWAWSFLLNGISLFLAYTFPFLTAQGAIHSGILGMVIWGSLGWRGWIPVVTYLLLGSTVTKLGYRYKRKTGIAESRGGRRGPENVWGSASTAIILALISIYPNVPIDLILIGFSASFASKLSDTFGSEIGKRWATKTILITSLQRTSPGSEGAISLEGTLASLIGSTLMTLIMSACGLISGGVTLALVASTSFVATLIESIIGATLQKRVRCLTNEIVNSIQTLMASLLAICGALLIHAR
uniref:TIGR00297 family protein n=1 Tax=Paulinella micropora TaxID=1928728 RepID=A0A1L5YCY9_9EUKA|nr:hypothetical protein PCKR_823 [Paulinella micropora]AQX45350.1 hypothetical protein PFK_823 [Paulinella micropora]